MSASKEKKLRREQREEGVEKRQVAQKDYAAGKKRSRIITTVVSIVVVVAIIAVIVLNSSLFYTKVAAVRIGDESYTAAEFNYYYFNEYYNMVNTYGNYLSYFGLDTSKPLKDQQYANDKTWADYFTDNAISRMQKVQLLCDEAEKNGFVLPEKYQNTVSDSLSEMTESAGEYGFDNLEQYVTRIYGRGVDVELVTELMDRSVLASAYEEYLYNSYEYSQDELEAYYQENADTYDYLSYVYYFCDGAADEDAGIDEETAMANAKALAESILEGAADEDTFKARVLELTGEEAKESRTQGNSVTTLYSEFILSADREYGDTTLIESDYGWHAVMFLERDDNHYNTVAARHILIKAEASEDGTYTEEAKKAALEKIEEIRDEYEAGDKTEESFAALAEQYSEDAGSNTNGGLYEGIYKNQMVTEFNDFCFEADRKPGDVGIVYGESTSYAGYHLVYFVGTEDSLYSDQLADTAMRTNEYNAWEEAALESYGTSKGFAMRFAR